MATKKEIKEHLNIALDEIGQIEPWFDENYKMWVFSHVLYPVEYAGETKQEVIKNYPFYLQDFIEERLMENLSPVTAKKKKGKEGKEKDQEDLSEQQKNKKKEFLFPWILPIGL